MIFNTLKSSATYETLGPLFAKAFQWLRTVDVSTLPDGKTLLDGDNLFVLVQRGLSKPLDQCKWEAHKNYADIQCVVAGKELQMWHPLEKTTLGEYIAEKDFQALTTTAWTELTVEAGAFTVFFPADAHRPSIQIPGTEPVVKLVVKVRV